MQSIFGVFPVKFRVRKPDLGLQCKPRELKVEMPLCVREYFPPTISPGLSKQKSRWVLGIGLQSWEQIKCFAGRWRPLPAVIIAKEA
jgi:adsorption protein B